MQENPEATGAHRVRPYPTGATPTGRTRARTLSVAGGVGYVHELCASVLTYTHRESTHTRGKPNGTASDKPSGVTSSSFCRRRHTRLFRTRRFHKPEETSRKTACQPASQPARLEESACQSVRVGSWAPLPNAVNAHHGREFSRHTHTTEPASRREGETFPKPEHCVGHEREGAARAKKGPPYLHWTGAVWISILHTKQRTHT